MDYHTIEGEIYWDESAFYRFSSDEVDCIEEATAELQTLCRTAVDYVIRNGLFGVLGIPEEYIPMVIRSWEMGEPSLYGRFDLCYDGAGPPKLLEYNADTPTSLLEASVVQWFWLKDTFPAADQFNSIHEKLLSFWSSWPYLDCGAVHFSCVRESAEDLGNIEYLRDVAIQGGMRTRFIYLEDIGWSSGAEKFVDLENATIETLFKLYPWEWLIREEFGLYLDRSGPRVIEPAWKMILSNKGILPILWQLFGGHPNLLESHTDEGDMGGDYVRKPLYSREGENIRIVKNGTVVESPGGYGSEGYIYQRYYPLPEFSGNFPVIGSWIVGGEPAGMGIREDRSLITTNGSRFVPHLFEED